MKLKLTRIRYAFEEEPYKPYTYRPWLTQDGTKRWWYDNGQLMYEIPYINGQFHGPARGWNSNGQLWYEELWVHGELRDRDMPRLEQVIFFGKVLI